MNNENNFFKTTGGKAVIYIGMYVLVFGIMSLLGGSLSNSASESSFFQIISLVLFAAWTILGWKSLTRIQPSMFLILPVGGWIAYFLIKGFLSVILGVFVSPYYLAKLIIKKIDKNVE